MNVNNQKLALVQWHRGHRAAMMIIALVVLALFSFTYVFADGPVPQVVLNTSKATPRSVEPLTESAILRDYKFAWASLSRALESNSAQPVNGLFEGTANAWVNGELKGQRGAGISSRYLNQVHKVDAVFYSPEGDLIELHDTAEYDLVISEGSKGIHDQHVIARYVVLMTPGVDRWVIRQMQAVPEF